MGSYILELFQIRICLPSYFASWWFLPQLRSPPAKCLAILSASPEIYPAMISPLAVMIQTLSVVPYLMDQIPSASMWSLSLLEEIAVNGKAPVKTHPLALMVFVSRELTGSGFSSEYCVACLGMAATFLFGISWKSVFSKLYLLNQR